jgi:23S rRNA (cytidine2498-2'-O)-methyltransferase
MIQAAYVAADGFEAPLAEELSRRGVPVQAWHGRLALSADPPVATAWALDVWTAPREIEVASVKAAADALRGMQRNWAAYAVEHHRRMALIGERLPPVKARPLVFPAPAPASHLGAWTLLEPNRLLASPTKTSPFVNGECSFEEDRAGPPSRAYLKLWEACVRFGAWPAAGERCLDLGAAPGGWTWALAKLGASVIAVDKAPLAPAVAAMPNVTVRQESVFGLAPEPVDWLFSDVVAYPDRLLDLAMRWIAAGAPRRIVCTLKFQGATDHITAEAFAAIPGGRLTHLFHNKHELTFWWAAPSSAARSHPPGHGEGVRQMPESPPLPLREGIGGGGGAK